MKQRIRICKWDKFNDIIEDRINKITMNDFLTLLETKSHNNLFIYKKIYQPNFTVGYFKKSYKQIDTYLDLRLTEKNDVSYPRRAHSIVCSTKEEDELGTTFLVFPFKESLFTIKQGEECLKGYWKDKIKWLEKFSNNELWTDNDCLLIKKSIWDNLKLSK